MGYSYPMAVVQLAPRIVTYSVTDRVPLVVADTLALPQTNLPPQSRAVFGDGSHPTTRLCAAALDTVMRQRRVTSVLDVGTGTGVLVRIARARGASFVVGTDIDAAARECARANADMDASSIPLYIAEHAPDYWGPRFDVTIANILEGPLLELAQPIMASVASRGIVLLSGFTRPQVPALSLGYAAAGGRLLGVSHLSDWAILLFERTAS